MTTKIVYLSKTDLLTLLNRLARRRSGEDVTPTVFKTNDTHPLFPSAFERVAITAVEDDIYYGTGEEKPPPAGPKAA